MHNIYSWNNNHAELDDELTQDSPTANIKVIKHVKHKRDSKQTDVTAHCRWAIEHFILLDCRPLDGYPNVPFQVPLQEPCQLSAAVAAASILPLNKLTPLPNMTQQYRVISHGAWQRSQRSVLMLAARRPHLVHICSSLIRWTYRQTRAFDMSCFLICCHKPRRTNTHTHTHTQIYGMSTIYVAESFSSCNPLALQVFGPCLRDTSDRVSHQVTRAGAAVV